jgi:hypothetical protein
MGMAWPLACPSHCQSASASASPSACDVVRVGSSSVAVTPRRGGSWTRRQQPPTYYLAYGHQPGTWARVEISCWRNWSSHQSVVHRRPWSCVTSSAFGDRKSKGVHA